MCHIANVAQLAQRITCDNEGRRTVCELSHEVIYEWHGHKLDIPVVLCNDIPIGGGFLFNSKAFCADDDQEEKI